MTDSDIGGCDEISCKNFVLNTEKVLVLYPVRAAYKFQCLRAMLLVLILGYLLLYLNWISDLKDQSLIVSSFYVSIVIVLAMLVVLYLVMARYQLNVEVYKDRLEYPVYYFWKRTLSFKVVFSLERIGFGGAVRALVVGNLDGGLTVFDRKRFSRESDFMELETLLSKLVNENKTPNKRLKTLYVHESKFNSFLVQVVLIFFLVLPLVLLKGIAEQEYFAALEVGALTKLVERGEEIYRFFSAFFLHSGSIHLFSNLIGFTFLAESLLRLCDTCRFLFILLVSAFIGSITSLYLSPHEYVIGASGGIFGLFGAYCVVKFTKYLPGLVSQRSNKMVFAIIALQVAIEYFVDGIDSYSHVGGFIAGALCMGLFLYFAKEQSIYKSTMLEKGLAVLLSGAYIWGLATFLAKVYA